MAHNSRQKLASVPPTSRAERDPHTAEAAHKKVVNTDASIALLITPFDFPTSSIYLGGAMRMTPELLWERYQKYLLPFSHARPGPGPEPDEFCG